MHLVFQSGDFNREAFQCLKPKARRIEIVEVLPAEIPLFNEPDGALLVTGEEILGENISPGLSAQIVI